MSLVNELLALLSQVKHEFEVQLSNLDAYGKELTVLQSHVDEALSGSSRKEEREMLDQIERTRRQIEESFDAIQKAAQLIDRVMSAL